MSLKLTLREQKFYEGIPEGGPADIGGKVMVGGVDDPYPLDLRLDLRSHSPTGFAWNYEGSGPAQLALAILADATGDDQLALNLYQHFKRECIATLGPGSWTISELAVQAWVAEVASDRSAFRGACPTAFTAPWF